MLAGTSLGLFAAILVALAFRDPEGGPNREVQTGSTNEARSRLEDSRQTLRMLALADDMPTPHARDMWILAANMARDGYRFADGRLLRMDVTELSQATSAVNHLSPPDDGGYDIEWRLTRDGDAPRSFLKIQKDGRFDRSVYKRFSEEWDKTVFTTGGRNIWWDGTR